VVVTQSVDDAKGSECYDLIFLFLSRRKSTTDKLSLLFFYFAFEFVNVFF